MRSTFKGELTAFLSILFVLLTAFICAIADVAAAHEEKCLQRAKTDLALYSLFGEYKRELKEEYHIFGVDAGYGSGTYVEEMLPGRLRYYGLEAQEANITDIQFLTDHQGSVFYEQAIYYMEVKYGLELAGDLLGNTEKWEEYESDGEAYEKDREELLDNVSGAVDVTQIEALEDPNARQESQQMLSDWDAQRKSFFLESVLPKNFELSGLGISLQEQPSVRELNSGYGSFKKKSRLAAGGKLLFDEYLLRTFSSATAPEEAGGLAYELEYLIAGEESDKENLEKTARKLLWVRYASNYAYLLTDEQKKAEAEAKAAVIAALLLLPEMTEVIKQTLLLLWAYRESVGDIQILLAGGKIPLVKEQQSWHSGLGDVFLSESDAGTAAESTEGMDYQEYLRMLLFCSDKEKLAMRGLDLIETGIRIREGTKTFRADLCVSGLKLENTIVLGDGISYTFPAKFAYR